MTYAQPEGQHPAEGNQPDPATHSNAETPPSLPPIAPATPYGATPQPQAPNWPYSSMSPYDSIPPDLPGPPSPSRSDIGPDHVPWRWYDLLAPALPLILGLVAQILTGLFSSATPTTNKDVISTPNLILGAVIGVIVYAFILIMIWVFTVRKYHVSWSALGIRRIPGWYYAAFIPIVLGMYSAVAIISAIIIQLFFGGVADNPQLKGITGGQGFSWTTLIIALITSSIAAPVVEELFFRGMLYGLLRTRWNIVAAALVSGALFSAAHGIPLILASIFVVGMTLAVVYEKTKSTLATMMLHSAFNSIGVLYIFIDLARK